MIESSASVYNDLSGLSRLKAESAAKPQEALEEAARQFESLFVSMMIKAMRDTLPEDSMFGSSSMKNYQEMFDQQLALDLSRKGGMGLSSLIARQLSAGVGAMGSAEEADKVTAALSDNAAASAALSAYSSGEMPAAGFEFKR